LPTPSNPWPEGIDYLAEQLSGATKKRGNLFAKSLKKLKVKIKIQEATDSLINLKRFIF
jgi:hypothetical protein